MLLEETPLGHLRGRAEVTVTHPEVQWGLDRLDLRRILDEVLLLLLCLLLLGCDLIKALAFHEVEGTVTWAGHLQWCQKIVIVYISCIICNITVSLLILLFASGWNGLGLHKIQFLRRQIRAFLGA
jgi:hypothetical protein